MNELNELFNPEQNENWKIEYAKIRFFTKDEEPFNLEAHLEVEDKAIQLLRDNIGKLYKYCSLGNNSYSVDNLLNSQVYLRNPNKFNDPFDSLFSILMDRNTVIDEILGDWELYNNNMQAKSKYSNEEFFQTLNVAIDESIIKNCNVYRDKTWVTCFSEVKDSILMWSHYADNHRGFCIEYDFSNTQQYLNLLSPVLYVDKLYNIDKHTFNGQGLKLCSVLKSCEWKYEKEWRFVISNLENATAEYWNVPKPTAIYLGACCKGDKRITDFAEQNDIKIYKFRMSTQDYKLNL